MSNEKTIMGANKIVSFEEIVKDRGAKEPVFSKGLYHWVMFILSLYTRVKEKLNIDFESFVILQVVVSHSLYETNKLGTKSFSDLEEQMEKITEKNYLNKRKLTFASIAEVLQLPRETVRRKVLQLCKIGILQFNSTEGIKLGTNYKSIYKEFVTQTTTDISVLIKKWKNSGALQKLLEMDKN